MRAWQAPPALQVVSIGDDRCFHAYLEGVLRHAGSYVLAGSFESGPAFLGELERARRADADPRWDLVLVDLESPGRPCLHRVKAELPCAWVVALTPFDDAPAVREALRAGADGWVPKYTSADRLLTGLGVPLAGGARDGEGAPAPFDLRHPPRHPPGEPAPAMDAPPLTARERAVLHCLVRGMSYKAAARELGISIDTVRSHIRSLYGKLHVHTVGEAVARAIRGQIV